MKFSVKVTLKKDVLDPQGKVIQQTLKNMGFDNLNTLRQGKYFEIEINQKDENKGKGLIDNMCEKLLVNLIIEDYEVKKIQ